MKKILLSLALASVIGCSGGEETPVQDPVKPVRYAEVLTSGGQYTRTLNGTTQSADVVHLSFRVPGQIESLSAIVGQQVEKGTELAQLDQTDIRLANQKAEANLASSQINLETARSSLERVKQLYQATNASLSEYETARNNYAASAANYESAQRNLDLEASNFGYSRIVAPSTGILSAVNAKVGEFAQAGQAIFVLNSGTGAIEIKVGMPERYISQTQQNDSVSIILNSMPERTFVGTVREVGFSAEGSTYPVTVRLENTTADIRPSMPGKVEFTFGEKSAAPTLFVPFKSVGEDDTGTFVICLKPTGKGTHTAEKTYVRVGRLLPAGFEVYDGVADGDLVATAGLKSLFAGREVSLLEN